MKLDGNYIEDINGNRVNHRNVAILHEYENFVYLELDDFRTIKKLKGTLEEYQRLEKEYWGK